MILLFVLLVTGCFAIVTLVGAPYVPSFSADIEKLFDAGGLKKGDRLIELGCGDGKVLIAAARRGVKSVGYELNPIIALIAWIRTRRYRKLVTVRWGDFWKADLSEYNMVFTFLITRFMPKLEMKMLEQKKDITLMSYIFPLPNEKPVKRTRNGYVYHFDGKASGR